MKLSRLCPPAIFIASYVYNTHTQFVQFFINNNNNDKKAKKKEIKLFYSKLTKKTSARAKVYYV